MKNKTFQYGKYRYTYKEIKEDRKTLSLSVHPDMSVFLKVPVTVSTEKIESFLKRKWMWLEKQLRYFEQYQREKYKKEYVSGESFLYLGRQYKLQVEKSKRDELKFKSRSNKELVISCLGLRENMRALYYIQM